MQQLTLNLTTTCKCESGFTTLAYYIPMFCCATCYTVFKQDGTIYKKGEPYDPNTPGAELYGSDEDLEEETQLLIQKDRSEMDTTAINSALTRERAKLDRQIKSIESTKTLIKMLEDELNKPTATTKK